jgi:hypothetical protein
MERKTFQGTRVNAYRSKNGNPTFVYRINNATEAELATYKAFKGATYRSEIQEVNGQIVECALVWAQTDLGSTAEFYQTPKGDFREDNTAMLSAEAAAKRYTWLQGEIAKQVVAQMDFGFKRKSVNITSNNVETEQEVKGLDKL